MSLKIQIPIDKSLKDHLRWWLNISNLLKGQNLSPEQPSVVLTTDASLQGYGAHIQNQVFQGTWSKEKQSWHINSLEMEAVRLAVQHFLLEMRNQTVLIRSDNTTVVQYVCRQGGTKSTKLCVQAWDLWNLALQNNIVLKAAHISWIDNILADKLSRTKIRHTEWSLNPSVTQALFNLWGKPCIDLFASNMNKKAPIFCSWTPDPNALAMDALSIPWEGMDAYAFPPHMRDTISLETHEQVQWQNDSGGTSMAKTKLVYRSSQNVDSNTQTTNINQRPVATASVQNSSSKSTNIAPGGMEVIN